MLTILEGVDGAGKSTLIEAIVEHSPTPIQTRHCGPIRKGALLEYEHALRRYYPGAGVDILCDRWHIGEMIYGPLLRDVSKVTPSIMAHIELFLASRGALKLWVCTPLPIVQQRIAGRGDDLITDSDIPVIWDWYNRTLSRIEGWYPSPGDTVIKRQEVEAILETARTVEDEASYISKHYKYYLGGPSVDVLIVMMAEREPIGATKWDAPFKPYTGTRANALLEALQVSATPLRYGLVNAAAPKLRELLRDVQHRKIIALGNDAFHLANDNRPNGNTQIKLVPDSTSDYYIARIVKEHL